ncbi:MAG: serine hydrolase [Spirochaetaceae bacterium]|nr:serine hydrolase [Spirochaetaceae bacterium]
MIGKRLFRSVLLAAVAAIAAAALPAEEIPTAVPEEVGMSGERLRAIDGVMQRRVDSGEIQGAVTALARRGRVVHFEAYGLMDVARGRAMREDAIFRMASSSKPVLAVAAMMLIEEGLLHPDDQVAAYLPEFGAMQVAVLKEPADRDVSPWFVAAGKGKGAKGEVPAHRLVPARRAITIHDLLTHTSGIDSSGLGSAVSEWPEPGPEATLASHVPLYAGLLLDFQPGTRWGYSPRVGHDVVARVIEIASRLPYDEFVRARIFEPLGMTDTHFFLPSAKEPRRVVIHGLDAKAKGWDQPSRYVSASGGLSSTARDYLRFEQMLANGGTLFGKRLLSAESVAAMSSNQVGDLYQVNGKQAGRGFGYGVAVVLDPAAANSARGKGAFGWGGAFGTTTWTDPEHEITAVLMVQQGSGRMLHDFEHAIRAAIVD